MADMERLFGGGYLPVAIWECTERGLQPPTSGAAAGDLFQILEQGLYRRVSQLPVTMWTPPLDVAHPHSASAALDGRLWVAPSVTAAGGPSRAARRMQAARP
jgi:hypothetical protein